ncbi:MAG: amidophosphoribosyltransferase [Candidatus Diapherotrites archaeon]|uniref:Amidophosphoribosyltransferase n=1 Tax=Candidatus Iainarchaeum sp. TaxID=3101447 RepID=A0A938YT96_9ARCH|nr:amidophosphoribosyltransferase [Candidatus Diapherotrites archaeon]
MDEIHESCGLAAVRLFKKTKGVPLGGAAYYLHRLLLQQQNRGQVSAGISTYSAERDLLIRTRKELGLVNELFRASHPAKRNSILQNMSGQAGIGHVRYATCGSDGKEFAMPFERQHGRKWKWFSFAFNGNLANFSELKSELENGKYHIVRNVDTEVVMHHIAKQFVGEKKADFKDIFSNLDRIFDGAYNLVYLNAEGTILGVRDAIGFKPLSYAVNDEKAFIASETSAYSNLGVERIADIKPGEMAIMQNGNVEVKRFAKSKRTARCMFEWVYFANVSSVLDGKPVYEARTNLGKELARAETEEIREDHIVVAVPDTATPAAAGMAFSLGAPLMEGLIRNRYVGRTFIESASRADKVRDKYTLIKSVLKDKKVILVEDSVVRGTTTAGIVKRIKQEGRAKEVHVRVSCPPIRYPCFYGIDMSTLGELILPKHSSYDLMDTGSKEVTEKEAGAIAGEIGADSVIYQPIKGLVKGIGLPESELCMACLNGDYPTECGKKLLCKAVQEFRKGGKKRTYE